jgi:uncharacterized protein YybS (DUF2232 family)
MRTRDILGCAGWAAFFFFVSALIPFVGPFFGLLTPLPFLYYSTKLGLYQGVKLAALSILIIVLIVELVGQPPIVLFGLEFSLLGLVLAVIFKGRFGIGQTIFLSTIFMLLLGFGSLFLLALSKNMGPIEIVLDFFNVQLKEAVKAYEGMGIPREKGLELEMYGKAFIDIISKIYPSLMIIGTGFAVWLNVVIAKPLFRMGNLKYPDFVATDRWQAPDRLIWVVIVSGFALFLFSGGIKLLAINALIVMLAIYFFHGLSIVLFFLNKYSVPSWARFGIYFLIIVQQLFFAILALAGLFDQWVDFRKIQKKTDS